MYEMLYKGKLPLKLFSVIKGKTIPHLADEVKIFYIQSGQYQFHLNHERVDYGQGDYVLIRSGQMHSYTRLSEEGTLQVLYVDIKEFKEFCDFKKVHGVEMDFELLRELFKILPVEDDLLILSKLSLVVRMICSMGKNPFNSKELDLVSKSMQYMLMNYKEKILMSSIAEILDVNEKQLMRAFKQVTDMTMLKYLTVVRLNSSLDLLHQNKTILEVALSNGFPDTKSFHKNFKEYFGMTPKEYKDKVLK